MLFSQEVFGLGLGPNRSGGGGIAKTLATLATLATLTAILAARPAQPPVSLSPCLLVSLSSQGGPMTHEVVRIGAVADVHYGRDAESRLRPLFEQAARRVDLLLLGGDL